MEKLIDLNDIVELKPLSMNLNQAKALDPYILEAQEFEIRAILGDPLFLKIIEESPNFPDPEIEKLFNGCEYTFEGNQYKHEGIKASLIYFTYARYLANANQTNTAFGLVQKKNDYSEHVSEKQLSIKIQQAKSGAIAYQNQYVLFLNRFPENYPLWNITCNPKKKKTSIRIRPIQKL